MLAYCLADFFNIQLWRRRQQPTYADIRDGLEDLVANGLTAMERVNVHPIELRIRLYGAWYADDLFVRVPLRELTAAVVSGFPRGSGPRITIDLAETPIWDRGLRLLRTLREIPLKASGGKIRAPSACPHSGACSIRDLQIWLQGSCPDENCEVEFSQVGVTTRQKMVDTLLTADAIALSHQDDVGTVMIASDDADMIPALLALTDGEITAIRLRRSTSTDIYYDGILESKGLYTHTW